MISKYRNRRKKKKIRSVYKWLGFVLVLVLFILSPFFQVAKSYGVMAVYSKIHENQSFLRQEGIDINIPGGLSTLDRDYYPFVMTFDTEDYFGKYAGDDIDLVVLYNFGYMRWLKGASVLYDPDSPYYNTFYGAYLVRYKDGLRQYGMHEDGSLNTQEANLVTDYDLKVLVMKSIGNEHPSVVYEMKEEDSRRIVKIDGLDFLVFDADIRMDSFYHELKGDHRAYIQYGRPWKIEEMDDFETTSMMGRFYVHFDQTSKISLFFYIITGDHETLQRTEESYIMKSSVVGIK